MSDQFAIVLDVPALVRGKMEPVGAAFYIGQSIDQPEAAALVEARKAKRVPVDDGPKTLGGYLDEQA